MSANKHTPGPWCRYGLRIDNGYGFTVAVVSSEGLAPDSETLEANADLVSAAPDLLAALEDCVAVMTCELAGLSVIQTEIKQARAAIAKATGEPQ